MHRPSRKYLQMYLPLCSTVCWFINSLLIISLFFWKPEPFPSYNVKEKRESSGGWQLTPHQWILNQQKSSLFHLHFQPKITIIIASINKDSPSICFEFLRHSQGQYRPCPGLLHDLVHVQSTAFPSSSCSCWASPFLFLVHYLCPFPLVQLEEREWKPKSI